MGPLLNKFRFFKSKKQAPEMITDSNYEQVKREKPVQDNLLPHQLLMLQQQQFQQSLVQSHTFLAQLPNGPYQVFGVPLKEASELNTNFEDNSILTPSFNKWENSFCAPEYQAYVPRFILNCVKFVNDYGLREEGLYRVSGSSFDVRTLRDAFIQHGPNYQIPPTTDVHAVTSLIKSFVRLLPSEIEDQPALLPITDRHKFLSYVQSEVPNELTFSACGLSNFSPFTPEEQDLNPIVIPTQILQEILQCLPVANFALVQTLTRHFAAIVSNEKYNRMSLTSLSLILCSTLKIHKSVFHALILKNSRIWEHLHPNESVLTSKGIKYDMRNIISYNEDSLTMFDSPPQTNFSIRTDPSSSNTSLTELTGFSSLELDPISCDIYQSTFESRRSSLMMISDADESYPKLTDIDDSKNKRFSEIFDYTDYKLSSLQNYRYQLSPPSEPKKGLRHNNRTVSASALPSTQRSLFLRKSVANF